MKLLKKRGDSSHEASLLWLPARLDALRRKSRHITTDPFGLRPQPRREERFVRGSSEPFSHFNLEKRFQCAIVMRSFGNVFEKSTNRQNLAEIAGRECFFECWDQH